MTIIFCIVFLLQFYDFFVVVRQSRCANAVDGVEFGEKPPVECTACVTRARVYKTSNKKKIDSLYTTLYTYIYIDINICINYIRTYMVLSRPSAHTLCSTRVLNDKLILIPSVLSYALNELR